MPATFNAVDPRTGTPGASFDEAASADVTAAVEAAAQAFEHPALRDHAARAAFLRGAAARLRAAGDAIVATAGAETGLPEARLRSRARAHGRPARGLRCRARRRRLRRGDHRHARPGRNPDPAPRRAAHARPARPGGRLRRQQLPARLLHRGGRHCVRARRRLPRRGQGPPLAPRHRASSSRASCRPPPPTPACRTARSRTCSLPASRSARRSSTPTRSAPSASRAPPPAAARSWTAPRAARTRFRSTPRWAPSIRSS